MKVIIQRVTQASVEINEQVKSKISAGLLILIGITNDDSEEDIDWLCRKIVGLRIFNDDEGVMNRSILEIKGEILTVSQFTLHAKTKKGNRPSYIHAAKADKAIPCYDKFNQKLSVLLQQEVQTGEFGADMQVHLTNDGPVSIIIDTKNKE